MHFSPVTSVCLLLVLAPCAGAQRSIWISWPTGGGMASSVKDLQDLAYRPYDVFTSESKLPSSAELLVKKHDQVVVFDPVTHNVAIRSERKIPTYWRPKASEFTHLAEVSVNLVRTGM